MQRTSKRSAFSSLTTHADQQRAERTVVRNASETLEGLLPLGCALDGGVVDNGGRVELDRQLGEAGSEVGRHGARRGYE